MLTGGLQKYEKFDFGATRQSKPSRNTELRRVPSRMKHNLSKSLYYGNTAFFRKMSDEHVKKQCGPRRRTYRRITKRRKNQFLSARKNKPSRNTELRRVPSRMANNLSKSLYYGNTAFFEKCKSSSGRGAVPIGGLQKDEKLKF